MVPTLHEYEPIVGKSTLDELKLLGEKLSGKVVQNINSTSVGGGVAEILNRMVPLLCELGVDARWDVIKGGEEFYNVTKKFHNALHGRKEAITKEMYEIFLENGRENLKFMELYGDIVFVHDPQPITLVDQKPQMDSKWVWRCHIDVSAPERAVFDFLLPYIERYDASVFSSPQFSRKLGIRQFLVSPSIDPLSKKNRELPEKTIAGVLDKYGLNRKIPMITQISRFDYLKDPVGVIEAFNLVRKNNKCQLVLAGGTATDDPESEKVLAEVMERAKGNPDIHVLLIPPGSDIEINALQRASSVVVQKSLREGFGLTVAEALWKGKPVVASSVGGIPLQIKHKYSGLLCRSVDGAAYMIKQLLHAPDYAKRLGENGRENIRQNFLLTRHLREYMLLFLSLYHPEDIVYL
jgi:trehalose synthase